MSAYNRLQEAQLLQIGRAMVRVIEYFAKLFNVNGHGTIRQIAYEFLLAFHSNLALTCIISD